MKAEAVIWEELWRIWDLANTVDATDHVDVYLGANAEATLIVPPLWDFANTYGLRDGNNFPYALTLYATALFPSPAGPVTVGASFQNQVDTPTDLDFPVIVDVIYTPIQRTRPAQIRVRAAAPPEIPPGDWPTDLSFYVHIRRT